MYWSCGIGFYNIIKLFKSDLIKKNLNNGRLNLVLVRANARALLSRAYGVGSDIPAFIGNHVHKALKVLQL